MPQSSVWLITGCSTGFGRELVRVLAARGHPVVATARNPATLGEFASNQRGLRLPVSGRRGRER
jgi:NAD(P)-dependent dehydrogenase (short-subunit alcohol dehydrogenase family)